MFAGVHVVGGEETRWEERLRQCALSFSPRWEQTTSHTLVFPVSGLTRLMGSLPQIARAIYEQAGRLGLTVQVAVAAQAQVAAQAAQMLPGITVIPPGEEAQYLSMLPVAALSPSPQVADILRQWGIQRVGQLAALPEAGVVERLGREGQHIWQRALGLATRPFVPEKPPLLFEDSCVLEEPIMLLEPLLFLIARLLNTVCTQLEKQALVTDDIRLSLRLENRAEYVRSLRLPTPTSDQRTLLKLFQLDLAAHPPDSPVLALSLLAQPAPPRTWQHGLFTPPAPEPQKLEVTLSRLKKLVGAERVGAPVLLDTHRPDTFRLERFAALAPPGQFAHSAASSLSLRYFRPPLPAIVTVRKDRPVRLSAEEIEGPIVSAAGPWRTAGDWWTSSPWSRDDWDVALTTGVLYRVFCEHLFRTWFVAGYYD